MTLFYAAFIDELEKISQAQITPAPMPKMKEQELFQTGTEFQRGQREKQLKQMAFAPSKPKIPRPPKV